MARRDEFCVDHSVGIGLLTGGRFRVQPFVVWVFAAAAFTFLIVDSGCAGRIGLNTTYTRSQLKDLCDKRGGTYEESPGGYSCGKQSADNHLCMVRCKKPSSCYGDCPKCVP